MNKIVRCVMCNSGEWQIMFIPSTDETKRQLNKLLEVYSHYVKVPARGPSASYVNDFMCQDRSLFYSFCIFCRPLVDRLHELNEETQNQIQLLWNIPFIKRDDRSIVNHTYNVSGSDLNPNLQQQVTSTSSTLTFGAHCIERSGTEAKRLKVTHDQVSRQKKNSSLSTSTDPGYFDISSSSCENFETDEAEVLVVEKNSSAQNKNIPTVSIDCDDNNGEHNPEIIVKQLDFSTYLFKYKNTGLRFKRSVCFLKFDCSSCSTQTQNITTIITHIWTNHCADGKVKSLPNYRVDSYKPTVRVSSSTRVSTQQNTVNATRVQSQPQSQASEPEIIDVDRARGLTYLTRGRVYSDRELEFHDMKNGKFFCSFCLQGVNRNDIVKHTRSCLPEKRGQTGTGPSTRPKPGSMPPPLQENGWDYYKLGPKQFKCGAPRCPVLSKNQPELFVHIRQVHAGIADGVKGCSCCYERFSRPKLLWIHLFKEHGRTHI